MEQVRKYNKLKSELLDKKERALLRSANALEKKLINLVFNEFISKLDVENGIVKNTKANRDRIAALNRLFDKFQRNDFAEVIKGMVSDYKDIHYLSVDYYKTIAKNKVENIQSKVQDRLKTNLGIEGNKLTPNGFLDSFIKDPTLLNKIKMATFNAITSNNITLRQYQESIRTIIEGNNKVEGSLTRHFKTFATDTYAMYDRVTNNEFAVQLNLKYALYAGGLIETSRPFCKIRNNKVFTDAEIKKFGTSKDKYGGYTNKSKGEFQGKNVDYDPFRDCGGYNCRHTFNYITESLAKRLRPELS